MKSAVVGLVALCAASGAWAGGLGGTTESAPVAASAPVLHDWSGPYAGLSLGVATGDNNWAERSAGGESDSDSWSGALVGVNAGMNWQSGTLVYGASLNLAAGSIDASSATSISFGCGGATCDTEVSNVYSLRGRIGKASGANLFYATAGFASGEAEGSTTVALHGSDRLSGWVAGVGMEHVLNDSMSIGIEYTYTDLGRLELPVSCGTQCYTDVTFGLLTIGANYHW